MWNQDLLFGKKPTNQEHNQDLQLKIMHIHHQLVRKNKVVSKWAADHLMLKGKI